MNVKGNKKGYAVLYIAFGIMVTVSVLLSASVITQLQATLAR